MDMINTVKSLLIMKSVSDIDYKKFETNDMILKQQQSENITRENKILTSLLMYD